MSENILFDRCAWLSMCEQYKNEIQARSGCNYELFVSNFSSAIDAELQLIPVEHHGQAIQIANDFDYVSEVQRDDQSEFDNDNGYCYHHFEIDCCPLGCGSL